MDHPAALPLTLPVRAESFARRPQSAGASGRAPHVAAPCALPSGQGQAQLLDLPITLATRSNPPRKQESNRILRNLNANSSFGPGISAALTIVRSNYISNALKYGGTPPIVELGIETLPDGMVRFWVRDNGAGLTPEQQAQLFAPFTRFAQLRAEGHGLGLSIVRRIIDRLGGHVGVTSTPDRGSEFYFCLPASRQER